MAGCSEDACLADLSPWYAPSRSEFIPMFLILHALGIAATYTAWVPKMPCSSSNGDEAGVCELVNTYTLIGTWIIPALRE